MFKNAKNVLTQHYGDFQGRAGRREYWLFFLFNILVMALLYFAAIAVAVVGMSSSSSSGIIFIPFALPLIYIIYIFIPSLAVMVRRLHDVNRSGAYFFIALIPIVGAILLFVRLVTEGDLCTNNYGPASGARASAPQKPAQTPTAAPQKPVQAPAAAPQKPAQTPTAAPQKPVQAPAAAPQKPVSNNVNRQAPAASASAGNIVVTCTLGPISGQSVTANTVTIGRDANRCNMVLPMDTKGVSREHCTVALNKGVITITDLDSSNGTRLRNGTILQAYSPAVLNSGDEFALSRDVHFRVDLV